MDALEAVGELTGAIFVARCLLLLARQMFAKLLNLGRESALVFAGVIAFCDRPIERCELAGRLIARLAICCFGVVESNQDGIDCTIHFNRLRNFLHSNAIGSA